MSNDGSRSFLDTIPGYGGYRDKERRRESDRLARETLARDYNERADRLGRIASRLANERKIQAMKYVDDPHQQLSHFISRLRTATYGYAPLFSEQQVDGAALDQIAEFDRAMADQLDALDDQIERLEQSDPQSDDFQVASRGVLEIIQSLHQRFDRRAEVIESARPHDETSIRSLLSPAPADTEPAAYRLHDGEAVSYRGENYQVVGRITIHAESGDWRIFQLRGGTGRCWLQVSASGGEFAWLTKTDDVSVDSKAERAERIELDGTPFQRSAATEATSEVIGPAGKSEERPVSISEFSDSDGGAFVSVYDWGTDQLAFRGESVDPAEVELWSREAGAGR